MAVTQPASGEGPEEPALLSFVFFARAEGEGGTWLLRKQIQVQDKKPRLLVSAEAGLCIIQPALFWTQVQQETEGQRTVLNLESEALLGSLLWYFRQVAWLPWASVSSSMTCHHSSDDKMPSLPSWQGALYAQPHLLLSAT